MNKFTKARNTLVTAIHAVDGSMNEYSLEDFKALMAIVMREEQDYMLELEGGDVRIINTEQIDFIQQEELENDTYLLGCFNAEFLANVTNIPIEMIEACQEAEVHDAVGKSIIALDVMEDLQQAYVNADGYGHHFASYDHEEHESEDVLIFRTN